VARPSFRDSLLAKASESAQAASLLAVGLLRDLGKQSPSVRDIPLEQWDRILTTAGVFVIIAHLDAVPLGEQRRARLVAAIMDDFHKLQADASSLLQDCASMVDETLDNLADEEEYQGNTRLALADAIGYWAAKNLFAGGLGSPDGQRLARPLGGTLLQTFHAWWSEDE